MADLRDRVVIVTGAAGGLGTALCARLARDGALVVPVDAAGEGMVVADVGSDAGTRAMVDEALARHGRLDGLVLNAGVQHVAALPDFPEDEWDRVNAVVLKGPFLAIKHAWPHLAERGGRIVVTASTSSFVAEPFKAAYIAAKHGVLGLVRAAALEGAPVGITVNAVAPSWMRTPLVERQLAEQMRLRGLGREETIAQLVERHPVKRFVEPDEVAGAIAFLLGPDASGINGACIPVDVGALVSG